jgi:hypothetical protein
MGVPFGSLRAFYLFSPTSCGPRARLAAGALAPAAKRASEVPQLLCAVCGSFGKLVLLVCLYLELLQRIQYRLFDRRS